MKKLLWLMTAVSAAAAGGRAHATDPDTAGIAALFARMDRALAELDERGFAENWHPAGYQKNLVGRSGLSGDKVFRQGARKGWTLKPLPGLKGLRSVPGSRGAPWIVPCDIWSRKRARAVDRIFALVIHAGGRWKMLGGGEKLAEVQALGKLFLKGKIPAAAGGKSVPALPTDADRACKRDPDCRVIHRDACGCGPCLARRSWALNLKAARRLQKQRSAIRCPRQRCARCRYPLRARCVEGSCRVLALNPNRVCKSHKDCVFAPRDGCGCPPCGPTPRRAVNRKHAAWLLKEFAREQCPKVKCAKCKEPVTWIGRRAVCRDGQCEVEK
jgi:hypothetical protein